MFALVVSVALPTLVLKGKPVMFIEVQSEAEEPQALVCTGHQQHQEMLDDALREEEGREDGEHNVRELMSTAARGGGSDLIEVGEDSELGAHLWYGFLELMNPLLLLRFLLGRHSPLTLNQHTFNASILPFFISPYLAQKPRPSPPPPYLLLSLLLLLFILQSEGEFLQGRAVQGVLGALELDDLVEYGPQLVQKRLDGQTETQFLEVCGNLIFHKIILCVCVYVYVTLLLLSSRHLEMMVSRKTSCAAMMWSRS